MRRGWNSKRRRCGGVREGRGETVQSEREGGGERGKEVVGEDLKW